MDISENDKKLVCRNQCPPGKLSDDKAGICIVSNIVCPNCSVPQQSSTSTNTSSTSPSCIEGEFRDFKTGLCVKECS